VDIRVFPRLLCRKWSDSHQSETGEGVSVKEKELLQAVETYYGMAGWDNEGRPTPAKLEELVKASAR